MEKQKNVFKILALLIVFIIIFVSGIEYGQKSSNTETKIIVSNLPDILTVRDNDAVKGESDILLIEYSDYECPFCQKFHPIVDSLVKEGEISWVYRHFPLNFHKTASNGAIIAECVKEIKGPDVFWEYTDEVFYGDYNFNYEEIALSLGLTKNEIDNCFDEDSYATKTLNQHLDEVTLLGINGTPGSFIIDTVSGRFVRIPGLVKIDKLRDILKEL